MLQYVLAESNIAIAELPVESLSDVDLVETATHEASPLLSKQPLLKPRTDSSNSDVWK